MFCTKCGKKLYDGDLFCGYCGTKVREELMFKTETKAPARTARYDEVVFNPPFKAEAKRRTQHIEEETKPYSSEPTKEKITLDWNLEGFPPAERKKDDFEINWDAVIERKRDSKSVNIEKILPETGFKKEEPMVEKPVIEEPLFVKPIVEKPVIEEPKEELFKIVEELKPQEERVELFAEEKSEEPLSIEELEKALFGTEDFEKLDETDLGVTVEYKSLKKKEDDFFTFNSKRDAFQELLDKERARIEALENERKTQWEELTPAKEFEYVPKKALEFDEVFKEPKLPLVPPLKEVAVVVPPLTARVMADAPENIIEPWYEVVLPPLTARVEVEIKEFPFPSEGINQLNVEPDADIKKDIENDIEEKVAGSEEKTKLRYSDVFPVDAFDTTGDQQSGKPIKEEVKIFFDDEEDDDDEDEKSGHGFIKFLIVILAIIVVVELVAIGAKYLAPESKLALMTDNVIAKVVGLFVDDEPVDEPVINTEENPIEKYVAQLSLTPKNIGKVNSDVTLKYDLDKSYAYDEVNSTSDFIDVAWNGDDVKTNGYLIVESVINYYDGWKDANTDEDIIGINQLSVGEVRTGGNGYYVLNNVIYQGAAGDVIEKTETVYLEASGDKIIVKEVKEETK